MAGRKYYVIELLLTDGQTVTFDEDPQPSIAKAAAVGRQLAAKRHKKGVTPARAVIIRDGAGSAVHREDVA